MRDNEKKNYLFVCWNTNQKKLYSDEKEEEAIKDEHKQTENIHSSGNCQLTELYVSNPMLLNKRIIWYDFCQPRDSGLLC